MTATTPKELRAEYRTVYLVDDDESIQKVLTRQLETYEIAVQCYTNPEAFLESVRNLRPGVVICDIRMPGIDGLEVQEQMLVRRDEFPMVIITGYPKTDKTVQAMKNGAVTVLEKPFDEDDLIQAVQQAQVRLMPLKAKTDPLPPPLPSGETYLQRLNEKERSILDLVYAGATNKVIAASLQLSVKTVEKHRSRVMDKMQVDNIAQLVRLIDRELYQ